MIIKTILTVVCLLTYIAIFGVTAVILGVSYEKKPSPWKIILIALNTLFLLAGLIALGNVRLLIS